MKLLIEEAESEALRSWVAERPVRVSSVIVAIEVRRAVLRSLPVDGADTSVLERADSVLASVDLIALDDRVVSAAGSVRPPTVRTLDVIHMATALTVPDLEGVVTYDDRLGEAARAAGLSVFQPGR